MLDEGSTGPETRLRDEEGGWLEVPRPGIPTLILFYRGDWCPWCNGQLASLARQIEDSGRLGGEVVGVSVDPPERSRALRLKLKLPFPLLSDPDGEAAIERYGAWSERERLARPAAIVVDGRGVVRRLWIGRRPADRAGAEEILHALDRCG
jgi:peroxiredoxin